MKFKPKDKQLLLELTKNGRENLSKLGKTCHISRQAVFSKIKSFKSQGIIRGFTTDLNQEKIGLNLKAYILMTIKPSIQARQKINIFIKKCKKISKAYYLFGSHDIILEVIVKNNIELSDLIKQFQKFEHVKKTVTMIIYDTIKDCQDHPIERILNENLE